MQSAATAARRSQMTMELCPTCRAPRNVSVTISRRTVVKPDGTTVEVETRTYHCESCHRFIRSEDVRKAADTEGGESAQT